MHHAAWRVAAAPRAGGGWGGGRAGSDRYVLVYGAPRQPTGHATRHERTIVRARCTRGLCEPRASQIDCAAAAAAAAAAAPSSLCVP
jgi:hypothetical protein